MSFHKLTEEEEERIAARWRRARANWRFLRLILAAILAAFLLASIYFAGEGAGFVAGYQAANRTP